MKTRFVSELNLGAIIILSLVSMHFNCEVLFGQNVLFVILLI